MSAPKTDDERHPFPREARTASGRVAAQVGVDDDPHEKDTVVPPYDVESYARAASALPPVPVTRSISGFVEAEVDAAPATVRRPGGTPEGLLDDPEAPRRIPFRTLSGARLEASTFDHREGFVLSLIDGQLDVETIVDVSGMPSWEVVQILETFRISGVITLS